LRDHDTPTIPAILAKRKNEIGWSRYVYAGLVRSRVFVWGRTDDGRLGLETDDWQGDMRKWKRFVPEPLELRNLAEDTEDLQPIDSMLDRGTDETPFRGARRWVQIVAGRSHTVARTVEGHVYAWGECLSYTWQCGPSFLGYPLVEPLTFQAQSIVRIITLVMNHHGDTFTAALRPRYNFHYRLSQSRW